jgi:hypothetical protein
VTRRPLFPAGRFTGTPGALRALAAAQASPFALLSRHLSGDYGDVPPEDAEANAQAVEAGTRIISAYTLPGGVRVWLITEADRSATTVLLPEEY